MWLVHLRGSQGEDATKQNEFDTQLESILEIEHYARRAADGQRRGQIYGPINYLKISSVILFLMLVTISINFIFLWIILAFASFVLISKFKPTPKWETKLFELLEKYQPVDEAEFQVLLHDIKADKWTFNSVVQWASEEMERICPKKIFVPVSKEKENLLKRLHT